MIKISETLLILDHLHGIIKDRTEYCKRHINFNQSEYIARRMNDYMEKGFKLQDIREGDIGDKIARECSDLRVSLHNYSRLNIIDIFSFNDEYNIFFSENNFDKKEIKRRIIKVKNNNKEIRKKIDWEQLKRFRNIAVAHNMRDRSNSNLLSINILKEINSLLMNPMETVEYAKGVLKMYENIELEFKKEIRVAHKEFNEKIE